MYVCLFFSLHFWRVTHRTHKLELLYTLGKGKDKYTLIIQMTQAILIMCTLYLVVGLD